MAFDQGARGVRVVEVPQNMHFELPEELSRKDRARDSAITAILWAVYLYLWVPLVSLLAWALGFEFAYDVMIRAGGARDLVNILLQYSFVVTLILGTFTIWSVSNRLRFKGLNRRTKRDPVDIQAIAAYFRVSETEASEMRLHQIIHVDVDASGKPEILAAGRGHFTDELEIEALAQWLDEYASEEQAETKKAV